MKNEKAWVLTPGHPKGTPLVTNLPVVQRLWFDSWLGRPPKEGMGLPTPIFLGLPGGSDSKESSCNVGDVGSIPGLGRSPGKGIATYCNILAWRIPRTEEHMTQQSHCWAYTPSKPELKKTRSPVFIAALFTIARMEAT